MPPEPDSIVPAEVVTDVSAQPFDFIRGPPEIILLPDTIVHARDRREHQSGEDSNGDHMDGRAHWRRATAPHLGHAYEGERQQAEVRKVVGGETLHHIEESAGEQISPRDGGEVAMERPQA